LADDQKQARVSKRRIVIPSAASSREESAVSLPAESRFLADKSGFGMTTVGSFLSGG